jgi:CRISPR/Cas system CSM-associated protein Csm2 small subunit
LSGFKEGEEQYQNFMKKFDQSPKDKDSYKKSMDIIKSKLFDNLYKNFKDDIDYLFTSRFIQKVKPYIERIQQKEITKNIEIDLGSIAFQLIKRKEKEEPQIELLKKYLSDRTEELNLKEDFKVEKLKNLGHANDVYFISNTEINQDDPNTIDYYAKSFSQDERIYAKNGLIDPNELFIYKILEYTGFGPECWFLMKAASSSYGTVSRGNFILTKKLGKGEGINFL